MSISIHDDAIPAPATTVGDEFGVPYVDIDEERQTPYPHRYIHGGFEGAGTRFSIYLPPPESYGGRFFQHFTPVPLDENLAQHATGAEDKIGAAFSAGGYFVETNGGGQSGVPGTDIDPSIAGYRANAAAAIQSRIIAAHVYGPHRPYGYAYGGSGGAYRTLAAAENTDGVWDGYVPYVLGSPMAIPNVFSVRMHAQRILRDRFDEIVDAIDAGGSEDPFATLNDEQAEALREVSAMGFPIGSWYGHRTMGTHAFAVLYPTIVGLDPSYFRQFWTDPGYLGSDSSNSIHEERFHFSADVLEVVDNATFYAAGGERGADGGVDDAFRGIVAAPDAPIAFKLSRIPAVSALGAELTVTSGQAAGTTIALRGFDGDLAVFDAPHALERLAGVRPGDTVELDNANFLAAQTYHRHQVPGLEYSVWDQFRLEDGTPRYPQRSTLLGPLFAAGAGHVPTGAFNGKVILVESLDDREAFPWQADWYRNRVREHLGDETDDRFRVWMVDKALHGDQAVLDFPTRTASYLGVLHVALRQLAAWVEQGVEPAASSSYSVTDGQVRLAGALGKHGGVQPDVELTVEGATRANAKIGDTITVELHAVAADDGGPIVGVDWDLDQDGEYEIHETIEPTRELRLVAETQATRAGASFVATRVSTQLDGDTETVFARVENIARARIVAD